MLAEADSFLDLGAWFWVLAGAVCGVLVAGAIGFTWWFSDSLSFLRNTHYRRSNFWAAYRNAAADLICLARWRRFAQTNATVQLMTEYRVLNPEPGNGQERDAWRAGLKAFLRRPDEAVVEFQTCFDLLEVVERIEEYVDSLDALAPGGADLPDGFKAEMVTRIRIRNGCFAPLFLLTGLLQEFSTHWPRDRQIWQNHVRTESCQDQHGSYRVLWPPYPILVFLVEPSSKYNGGGGGKPAASDDKSRLQLAMATRIIELFTTRRERIWRQSEKRTT